MLCQTARYCALGGLIVAHVMVFTNPLLASPGHDHDHQDAQAVRTIGPVNPRLVLTSDAYELVGMLVDKTLKVYLDQRADTSPITDAKIKLTIGDVTRQANAQSDGTYHFTNAILSRSEKFEVVAEIYRSGADDLLVGVLDTSHAATAHQHDDPFGHDHAIHHPNGQHTRPMLPDNLLSIQSFLGLGIGVVLGFLAATLRTARSKSASASLVVFLMVLSSSPDRAVAGPNHDHGDHGHEHSLNIQGNPQRDVPGRMTNGNIFLPKPTQRLLEIRTRIVAPEQARRSERLIGRVIPDPNRNGLVQSSIKGRIKATESGLPVLGQRVVTGEPLAFVDPAFAPIDSSDVRQTAGDLEQRIVFAP